MVYLVTSHDFIIKYDFIVKMHLKIDLHVPAGDAAIYEYTRTNHTPCQVSQSTVAAHLRCGGCL